MIVCVVSEHYRQPYFAAVPDTTNPVFPGLIRFMIVKWRVHGGGNEFPGFTGGFTFVNIHSIGRLLGKSYLNIFLHGNKRHLRLIGFPVFVAIMINDYFRALHQKNKNTCCLSCRQAVTHMCYGQADKCMQ